MLDNPQNEKVEKPSFSLNLLNALNDSPDEPIKITSSNGLDTSSTHLPGLSVDGLLGPIGHGEAARLTDNELANPFDAKTQKMLMKDADQFAPKHNPDGSTTYTVVQSGITDRPGRDNGIDYYRRNVDVTVPAGNPSLQDCQFVFNARELITKDQFDKNLQHDKAFSPEMDLYTHGISATDMSADRQGMTLQLVTGRPTIDLDWNANGPNNGNNPLDSLKDYAADTINAKRANDNKDFQQAIDNTIQDIGADHTSMIGFSHGGLFDVRYLAHRVQANLPKLEDVILTHPDVPISAPELNVNGKPELLKDSAQHSYVIGGEMDLAMKAAVLASHLLPGTPTFEGWFETEERLGNDSETTRSVIQQEGAMPISEDDRPEFNTEHFLNSAGIRQILDAGQGLAQNSEQNSFNAATDIARLNPHNSNLIGEDSFAPDEQLLAS